MSSILTNPSYGAVAQLGERLPCTEEVAGSTPVSSTGPQWRRGRKVMHRIANPICVGASPTDASKKRGTFVPPFLAFYIVGGVELFRVLLTK